MILLTGSTGMIGRNIKEKSSLDLFCPMHEELDLTDRDKTKMLIDKCKPSAIIHCASNDDDVCLYDNLRMFDNLASTKVPMVIFCTGREIEDRSYKNGEYVLSKHISKDLALNKYNHISVIQIWGCFGMYERPIRLFRSCFDSVITNQPIIINEDKLFSYVYVNDLVSIVDDVVKQNKWKQHIIPVAYTNTLSYYALLIKWITRALIPISVDEVNKGNPYVGINSFNYQYTNLIKAIREYWEEYKANAGL